MAAERYYPRLTSPPKGSFFLFGARGVGKSTWARERFPGRVGGRYPLALMPRAVAPDFSVVEGHRRLPDERLNLRAEVPNQ
jgi:hypothetical protein